MLDKNIFTKIRNKLHRFDKLREEIIKNCRDLLKTSKQIIYSVHRHDLKNADLLVKKAILQKNKIDAIANKDKNLFYEGSYSEAMQEYVEAFCYYYFVKDKRIPSPRELKVNEEDYLMGICDLTGELSRRAVNLISKKEFKEVKKIKDLVEDIHGEFLKFNLPNGNLRKKSDSIKWNLKKLEEIMYDINIKR